MHGIIGLSHIEASGFHAGCGVRSGDVKLHYALFPDEPAECFARQRIGFRLYEDVVRNDLHFRRKLCSFCSGLEGARACGQVVVLYIDDFHSAFRRPTDGAVEPVDDVTVMLRDVVLNVDDHKRFTAHNMYLQDVRCV